MIEPNKHSLNTHNLSLKFWFYRYFLSGLDTYYNKFITWYIYMHLYRIMLFLYIPSYRHFNISIHLLYICHEYKVKYIICFSLRSDYMNGITKTRRINYFLKFGVFCGDCLFYLYSHCYGRRVFLLLSNEYIYEYILEDITLDNAFNNGSVFFFFLLEYKL